MPHEDYCYALERENHALNEKYESLRQQLEIERMRNVACDVVAMADTPTSAEEARKMLPDYRSAALESVIRRVDECIALRQQLVTLKTELRSIGEAIDDPRTDLTMTMSEIIIELKQQLADSQKQVALLRGMIAIAALHVRLYDDLTEALAIQPDDSALKDKAMTTYEQPKDWIERHLVEDPGGLLACEPSGLNEELKLARQANEFQHQTIKKQAAQIATMRETALNQQKREVMLRDALHHLWNERTPDSYDEAGAALAATADLDGLILCHADPVAFLNPYGGVLQTLTTGLEKSTFTTKLYNAWEPK